MDKVEYLLCFHNYNFTDFRVLHRFTHDPAVDWERSDYTYQENMPKLLRK